MEMEKMHGSEDKSPTTYQIAGLNLPPYDAAKNAFQKPSEMTPQIGKNEPNQFQKPNGGEIKLENI